jgi:hypothetical protein
VNASGAVLVLAGVWVLAQVLGGDALHRLHLVDAGDAVFTKGPIPTPGGQPPGLVGTAGGAGVAGGIGGAVTG